MEHRYRTPSGEVMHLTIAVVTAAEQEGKIVKDEETSTEHVTWWKKAEQ